MKSLVHALGLLLLAITDNAFAANLLINSSFTPPGSFSGWRVMDDTWATLSICDSTNEQCGQFQKSTDDCCGDSSGSAYASNSLGLGPFPFLAQCISGISANTAYDYGTWYKRTPISNASSTDAVVRLDWFSSTDCGAGYLASATTGARLDSLSTEWRRMAIPHIVAPVGSQSALISINPGARGTGNTVVTTYFDDVFFGPSGTVPVELQSFSVD